MAARTIEITEPITVGHLAELLELPASQLIAGLFKNGIAATINETIDFDTAQIIVGELELDVELVRKPEADVAASVRERKHAVDGQPRPPVVAFMGHVDHGKTSLLDAIRGAEIAAHEAGGITQHISAFQITHNGRQLTLLDTPGHEAFAALREHGARLTDVVVIVIAADEGIKPQTLEAIRFAQSAGVKLVVAANKIDKATPAQLNQLKSQLAENNLAPEGFGGDTVVISVSAKTKEGIGELLDMVLLVADVEELKADTERPAEGMVIEAHMEQGRGPLATVLVEQGTLKPGSYLVAGTSYGKVRSLESTDHQKMDSAGPSTPAVIIGLKSLPNFADEFKVIASEKEAKSQAGAASQADRSEKQASLSGSDLLRKMNRSAQLSELNVLVKADVQGSLTSVVDSLKTLNTDEVAARIVGTGVGVITESDVHLAASTGAIIYGFHVELPTAIKQLSLAQSVSVRLFKVIYELLDDVKKELETRLTPEVVETPLGELSVKGVFKITKTEVICGGEVIKGKLSLPALARLKRDKKVVADELEVVSLKKGPQEVSEVLTGEMCGLSFRSSKRVEVHEDDRLELFSRQTKIRSL